MAIRMSRKHAKMSAKELGDRIGISTDSVLRTELGMRDVGYLEMRNILKVLKVEESLMLDRARQATRKSRGPGYKKPARDVAGEIALILGEPDES